jgi:putative transposase
MCAFERREYFVDAGCTALVRTELLRTASDHTVEVIAYCFMPDHVHILLEGGGPTVDVNHCAAAFRQRAGYAYRRLRGGRLWQDGYFDRLLRREEATCKVAGYIIGNPVRAGLCAEPTRYPFSGSSRYTLEELIVMIQSEVRTLG